MNTKKKKKILIITHDAGGGNILLEYVLKYEKKYKFFCYAVGPAKKLFTKNKIRTISKPSLEEIDLVLTGTSGSSEIEIKYIEKAKRRNIKTATYSYF